jgi:calcineurin-like phosphoesterase family protein
MEHFITADLHFGHGNILKYCHRIQWMTPEEIQMLDDGLNFKVSRQSVEAMNSGLISEINRLVGPEDVLWFLGDFCFASEKYYLNDAWNYRKQINCQNIHFFWGNHDHAGLEKCFTSDHERARVAINPDGTYSYADRGYKLRNVISGASKFVMGHTMDAIWDGSHKGVWHLYGHSHSTAEQAAEKAMPGRCSMDVGIDNAFKLLGRYSPFSLSEISQILSKKRGWEIDHHKSRSVD